MLPYASDLDGEAGEWWRRIKSELVSTLMRREVRPGAVIWITRLTKYIRHYGHMFPKSDHLALVRLFYGIVVQPELEPWFANKVASALVTLIRKRELLTPDDLRLEWRPLYEMYERLFYSHHEAMGMVHYPASIENNMRALIRCARVYFPPGCTQEMLDEWRPLMCPYDVTMGKAMAYFR